MGECAVSSAETFASIAGERCHYVKYTSPLQIAQHQEVLDQIRNGIVPVAETKFIHAAMPLIHLLLRISITHFQPKIFACISKENSHNSEFTET
jgi:hypothetical protein